MTYRTLYFQLFGAIEDALDAMERGHAVTAIHILLCALETAEAAHMDADILPEK